MRLFASFCIYLGFCVGLYLLLILVYFIREWELLMWAIGVPIELIKSKSLLWRLSIVSMNWFALNLVYYGISMNVAKFGGDLFVNYAASSSAELLAILFSQTWLTTSLAMIGKFFVSIAFFVVYMLTAELFPTVLRASSLGLLQTSDGFQ
ncbi:solute carrier family 22 member 5-like [Mytilus californianus]|uniref:solute carrier family 22 member 5-like n=1 Tax=Mytilus californianus TaxID=6549 RepID=UPI0022482C25|nr:solute carrier family 22 member 5-like [Mytilus californianus]